MKKAYIIKEDFKSSPIVGENIAYRFNNAAWYLNADIEDESLHIIKIKDGEDLEFKVPKYMKENRFVTDNLEVGLFLELVHNLTEFINIKGIAENQLTSITQEQSHIANVKEDGDSGMVVEFCD